MQYKFFFFPILAILLLAGSCSLLEVEDVPDLNNPTVESVLTNATVSQIQQLGVGIQANMRTEYGNYLIFNGSIGRECVYFAATESRYYTELQGSRALDPGGIMYPWYPATNQLRRRAEILSLSADKSTAMSPAQKAAVKGFARTAQAFSMLNCLNMMGSTGIRTSFTDLLSPGDLLKPGKFDSYDASLTYLKRLADEGAAALDQAGTTAFPFPISAGLGAFKTPADMKKFNRAIAARIAMYQKDWAGMNTALDASFINPTGNLNAGAAFNYSITAGDATNPMFQAKDEANRPIAMHSKLVAEAEAGDTRIFGTSVRDGGKAKVRLRTASVSIGGFPASEYEWQAMATNVSDLFFLRNEELILMRAEAQIQTDKLSDGEKTLDIIRVAHGLKPIAEAKPGVSGNKNALIDELLNQRRYSLLMEGHRWFDMRRYNRLAQLPLDLPTHKVLTEFGKPQAEIDWDKANP